MKQKGLGDTVQAITKATGIEAIVKKVAPNCGCAKRQKTLNDLFPYKNA
jgi:hypothetical protein